MNKKFLSTAFCSALSLGLILGVATFSHGSTSNKVLNTRFSAVAPEGFEDCVELDRKQLRAEIKSATATSDSKCVTVEFTSARVQGFAPTKKIAYVVIDSEDYSEDPSNPSLSNSGSKPYAFTGYTIELCDIKDSVNLVIPTKMTFGSSFTVDNYKIVSESLSLSKGYIETLVIPEEITTIEANAIDASARYLKTLDKDINAEKTYYTVDESSNYVAVAEPVKENIGSYYEYRTITIKCEAASKPAGWDDAWTNVDSANIQWGYEITADEEKSQTQTIGTTNTKYYTKGTQYLLGYQHAKQDRYHCKECNKDYLPEDIVDETCPEGHHHDDLVFIEDKHPVIDQPITVEYNVNNKAGEFVRKVVEKLPVVGTQTNPVYDAAENESFSRQIDILLKDGEALDYDSFAFYNIYTSKKVSITETNNEGKESTFNVTVPDESERYCVKALKRFDKEVDIFEIIDYKYDGMKTFGDYTMITMNVDKVMPSYYESAMSSMMKTHADKIASGEYVIRYVINNLANSKYGVTYVNKNGDKVERQVKIVTPLPVIELNKDKGNKISFLVKNSDIASDFKASSLRKFELISFTVDMHLWNTKNNNKVGRSDLMVRFGGIEVLPLTDKAPNAFSLVTFLILFFIIYTVVYAVATYVLFRTLTEKFKNDEFRRIKPKAFFKTAILGYFGSDIVILTILSIIFRFGIFANSIAAFNPVDVIVVLSGIVSIVIIGYFIKYLVGVIKAEKKRREAKRLRLNEDKAADGTN